LIAIVGRPNVGKSTLFNRLIGARKAVVASTRGTTRDRVYGQAEWRGVPLMLVDTGGFEFGSGNGLTRAVQLQIGRALKEADAVLLVCDGREGLVPMDEMVMERLRTMDKPVVLAVNKLDHRLVVPPDFFALGVADPVPVSAMHGRGTGDLLDRLVTHLARRATDGSPPRPSVSVAIIGRQNVGKSSLLNALLREERMIVHEAPGTTRDAVDTLLRIRDDSVLLVDTAGLRRRRKVKDPVDLFAMSRTVHAIERCDVALAVLDATQGVTREDQRIVDKVCEAGRGLVLLVNKWDLVKGGDPRKLTEAIRRALPFAAFAPVLAISAKTGFHVPRSVAAVLDVVRRMRQEVPEADCRAILQRAWAAHPPPRWRGRVVRVRGARWIPGCPVRMELVTHPAGRLSSSYQRYLLNALQAYPRLAGVPIRLVVK
jgi:GTP-binding protein